jgi:hypothetical protein
MTKVTFIKLSDLSDLSHLNERLSHSPLISRDQDQILIVDHFGDRVLVIRRL